MGKGRPTKYNRVSCQQKFMLRRLIDKEKMSVKQVKLRLILGFIEVRNQLLDSQDNNVLSSTKPMRKVSILSPSKLSFSNSFFLCKFYLENCIIY